MELHVREIQTTKDLIALLIMAEANDITPTIICKNWDDYGRWLIQCVFNNQYKVSAIFEDEMLVGYLVMGRHKNLTLNELYIYDLFILESYRGKELRMLLFNDVGETFLKTDAQQIRWSSQVLPPELFQDLFGTEVKSYKTYYIDRTKENEEKYYENIQVYHDRH